MRATRPAGAGCGRAKPPRAGCGRAKPPRAGRAGSVGRAGSELAADCAGARWIRPVRARTGSSTDPTATTRAAGVRGCSRRPRLQVGQDHGDRLADDPAAVDGQAVLAAQHQPRVLQVHQLLGRDVDGDLLVVPLAAAGPAVRRRRARLPARLPDPGRGGRRSRRVDELVGDGRPAPAAAAAPRHAAAADAALGVRGRRPHRRRTAASPTRPAPARSADSSRGAPQPGEPPAGRRRRPARGGGSEVTRSRRCRPVVRNSSSAPGRLTRRDTGRAPPWRAGGRRRRRRSWRRRW